MEDSKNNSVHVAGSEVKPESRFNCPRLSNLPCSCTAYCGEFLRVQADTPNWQQLAEERLAQLRRAQKIIDDLQRGREARRPALTDEQIAKLAGKYAVTAWVLNHPDYSIARKDARSLVIEFARALLAAQMDSV